MSDVQELHALVKREQWPAAWELANKLLNTNTESPEILYLMGATLRATGNLGLAYTVLSKALAKERRQPNLWMNYAATLHDLNRWEDAEKAFEVVHQMLPDDPMPPANIGATYTQRGKWHDAINWCDKALALDPENHIAQISKNFACLSMGRWKDGWKYAEALYGKHLGVRVYNTPDKEEPFWDGAKGKTVVVQCDQGLGDQIMFAQCLPQLQSDCKRVIVECSKRMEPFFKRNFPGIHVYGTLKDQRVGWAKDYEIDAHVHISLLGKWYRTTDKEFPRKAYITAGPQKLAKWQAWLSQFPRPWIGIGWKGGIQATQTHLRSMELTDLAPILSLPGSFIDLSYMDNGAEISRWNIDNKGQVIRPPVDAADYEDTIALVAALDEVVTVTTTVAHVCGALGRTAHVLVPEVAQWRYAYRCGDGLIWYPEDSVRLYRQKPGETGWAPAIKRVCKDLSTQRHDKKAA
jgi:Anaphase-promoting complex, cyclosome, subunit 3/Tetratricopeptide repeat